MGIYHDLYFFRFFLFICDVLVSGIALLDRRSAVFFTFYFVIL